MYVSFASEASPTSGLGVVQLTTQYRNLSLRNSLVGNFVHTRIFYTVLTFCTLWHMHCVINL